MTAMSPQNFAWHHINHDGSLEHAKAIRSDVLQCKVGRALGTIIAAGLTSLLVAVLLFAERPPRQRALEATVRMEQLTAILGHGQRIAPDTARTVSRLIQQPAYDCRRVAVCGPALELRNMTARAKLMMLIGSAAPHSTASSRP